MLILALDTSGRTCGVAVAADGVPLVEYVEAPKSHSARLVPLVAQALAAAGVGRRDLDAVAVTVGPGSYTGLRIGIATARTLAFALGLPLAGVSTLEALAFAAGPRPGLLCPVLDARRRRVYAALYRWRRGELEAVAPPRALPLADLLAGLEGEQVHFTGEGVSAYAEELAAAGTLAPPDQRALRPGAVAALGQSMLAAGAAGDPAGVLPIYLTGAADR